MREEEEEEEKGNRLMDVNEGVDAVEVDNDAQGGVNMVDVRAVPLGTVPNFDDLN